MRAPHFWQDVHSWRAKALLPCALLYAFFTRARLRRQPNYVSRLPVICVGNATMGGSGKTPVVQAIAALLQEMGEHPAILLRGYGGSETGPVRVDMNEDDASSVGDEAILHSGVAPTYIAADRAKGAKEIEKDAAITHILMDDGLQNPALKKDISFLVIDGENPFGNGLIFPAGPLRESMADAVKRIQGLVILGEDRFGLAMDYHSLCPVFRARLTPLDAHVFSGVQVIAFAGIGRPEKFFNTLEKAGAILARQISFGDHHAFTEEEMRGLLAWGDRLNAPLVTTRKDWVRLPASIQPKIHVLDVQLEWEDRAAVADFLAKNRLI